MKLPSLRRAVRPSSITLATIVMVVGLFALGPAILDPIEQRTYDLRVRARGAVKPSPAIVIAAVDEKSLAAEGRWPWPRSKLAALVDALSRDGARVIGFDVAFAEPDENPGLAVLAELNREVAARPVTDPRLAALLRQRRDDADNDAVLAKAIKRSSAAVVLGYFFHLRKEDLGYPLDRAEIARRLNRIGASRYPVIASRAPDLDDVPLVRAYAPQPNLDILTAAASSSGFVSAMNDEDGVLRWMPLAIGAGDGVFPSLALLCAWEYRHRPPLVLRVGPYGVDGVEMGDEFIPTHENGQLLLDYLGPPGTFPYVSVTDVLRGAVPAGTFAGKVVLVGATALGTHDLLTTPFSPVHPGAELHATVIDNILTRRLLHRQLWWKAIDLLAIVVLTGLAGIFLPRLGALAGLLLQIGLFGGYAVLAVWLFTRFGMWIGMAYPLMAVSISYTGLTAYRFLGEQRERRRIKSAFRQYVAPLVVEEMLKDPGHLKLGGEEKTLTVLFCDLESFTTHSEKYGAREMFEILSEYYGRVTAQVFAHWGTLKEYVGDELMAFFGAPLEQPDHAQRACAAALAMRDQRLALNAEWAARGRPPLRARTGINSGPMLVGNIGSKYRFAYGVLGDQVNLGSRLEGLNRVYGTEILVGENTAGLVGEAFRLRELDTVRAKGKQQAIRVYELLARAGTALPPGQEKAIALYAGGLEAYRKQRWREALSIFEEALAAWPGDGPAAVLAGRCRAFQATPPVGSDGVFVQTLSSYKDVA